VIRMGCSGVGRNLLLLIAVPLNLAKPFCLGRSPRGGAREFPIQFPHSEPQPGRE